jgi:hypothetical protein
VEAMNNPTSPEKISTDAVEAFVKENVVKTNRGRVECGDGRYAPEQSGGAIRALGGDFGMVFAFASAIYEKGLKISSDKLVEGYLNAVKTERGEDARLFLHTDDHNKETGGIGCGHAKLASSTENEGKYGSLTSNETKTLFETMLARLETSLQVLEGSHAEKAVIFVYGTDEDGEVNFSVNSQDKNGNMYFIVDMDGIKKHMEKFVPRLSEGLGVAISASEVLDTYEKQQTVTAEILAGKLDMYKVDIDNTGTTSIAKLQ